MQAQQLVFLARPVASAVWRGRGPWRLCPEPRGTPTYRLRGTAQPLCHVLQRGPAGGQLRQTLVVLDAPAAGVGGQTELAGAGGHARRAAVRQPGGGRTGEGGGGEGG